MFLGNSIKGILLLLLSHIFLPLLLSIFIPTVPLVFLGYVLPFLMEHEDKDKHIHPYVTAPGNLISRAYF